MVAWTVAGDDTPDLTVLWNKIFNVREIAGMYGKYRPFQKDTATTEGRNVPKSNIS